MDNHQVVLQPDLIVDLQGIWLLEEGSHDIPPRAIYVCNNQYFASQSDCADAFLLVVVADCAACELLPMGLAELCSVRCFPGTPPTSCMVNTLPFNVGTGGCFVSNMYCPMNSAEVEVVRDLWVVA